MNFLIDQTELNKGLSIIQRAIVARAVMPELKGVLIEAEKGRLKLTTTDSEIISIETYLDCNIIVEGSTLVDAKLFSDIVRRLPSSQISISVNENMMTIQCERSHFELMTMDPIDYPKITRVSDENQITISADVLKNAIRQTSFAVSQDMNRKVLTGVNIEIEPDQVSFVSLDGYRLSVLREQMDTNLTKNAIVPGRALNELSRIIEDKEDVKILITGNNICFRIEGTNFYSQLIEGEYFNYTDIIRKDHASTVTVDKEEFQRSLERAGLLASQDRSNLIKLEIKDGMIKIMSNTELGSVEEEVAAKIEGIDQMIAFNSRYLLEGIRNMDDQELILQLQDDINPMIIEGVGNDDYLYLVLPVRVA